jgi:hypothetical protein
MAMVPDFVGVKLRGSINRYNNLKKKWIGGLHQFLSLKTAFWFKGSSSFTFSIYAVRVFFLSVFK